MATMIVGMGGAGGNNTVRAGVEIGFNEGIDIARAEGNRKRVVTSSKNRVIGANRSGKIQGKAAGVSFVSSVAQAGLTAGRASNLSLSSTPTKPRKKGTENIWT